MAESSGQRAPRRKAATTAKPRTAAAPKRPASAPDVATNVSAGSWLDMFSAVLQAPVGIGRDQAARLQSATDGLDRFIESRIEDVLNRVNIPSRSDIERLNRSVDLLTTKVDALLSRQRGGN